MIDDTHFEGFVITYPQYVYLYDPEGKVAMYFYGEVNKKPVSTGSFTAEGIQENSASVQGKRPGFS